MAATLDSALGGNTEINSFISRGGKIAFGRFTGTYGGAWTTTTVPGMTMPAFVYIQPASNCMFTYAASTTQFAIFIPGSLTSTLVAGVNWVTCSESVDLSSFTCIFNGVATVGVPFLALGF